MKTILLRPGAILASAFTGVFGRAPLDGYAAPHTVSTAERTFIERKPRAN